MRRSRPERNEKVSGSHIRVAIVVSRFNSDVTDELLDGAFNILKESDVRPENVEVTFVPGAFEIPLACARCAEIDDYDGIIALGCIVEGETDHDWHVATAVSQGIMDVSLSFDIPIGFGVLTVRNLKQAKARSHGRHNAGREAAEAMLQMV